MRQRQEMETIKHFKELKVWQKGIEIVKDIYEITKHFPKEEMYGLTTQMRRSAISIPSNIAEGFKRFHAKEYVQFLYIALGSLAELETQIFIAKEIGLLEDTKMDFMNEKLDHTSKMLSSLISKLR
jgi:four helix bundle protein